MQKSEQRIERNHNDKKAHGNQKHYARLLDNVGERRPRNFFQFGKKVFEPAFGLARLFFLFFFFVFDLFVSHYYLVSL